MPPRLVLKKPKYNYTHDQLLQALEALRNGENAFRVSKRFGVPRSTLLYKASGKLPLNKERKLGPAPRIGFDAEKMLKNWVTALASRGFPVIKDDLITSVQQILKDMGEEELFNGCRPGKTWLKLFLKRNPIVRKRTVEKLSSVRAAVTEKDIKAWFDEVYNYIETNDLKAALSDSSRVFNMDETGFSLCPKSGKVLGIRGQKNVYEVNFANEKEMITVLASVSAAGNVAPSLVVYPGQRLPAAIKLSIPQDWTIGKSENGWMTGEVFYEYFVNYFHKWMVDNKTEFPVIVFLDGHKSHLTYHLSKFCSENQIVLVALPPNCTTVLQPLDVSLFHPVKQEWAKSVHKWRMANGGERLTKFNFVPMLKEVMDTAMKKQTVVNGFRCCGLYPFNKDAVDYTKVDILNAKLGYQKTTTSNPSTNRASSPNFQDSMTQGHNGTCLEFLEKFIHSDLLVKFEDTYRSITPIWAENDSAHDLFVVWKKAKDYISQQSVGDFQLHVLEDTNQGPSTSKSSMSALVSDHQDPGPSMSQSSTSTLVPDHQYTVHQHQSTSTSTSALDPNIPNIETPIRKPNLTAAAKEKLANALSPETNGADVPSPFKNNLFWPGTPKKSKRKTKRACKKLPAVVSGSEWQNYQEKLREEKKSQEEEKAERKRIREEKRASNKKKNSKKSVKRKLNIEDEEDDWTCKVCQKRYSSDLILNAGSKWINCDSCSGAYHYKCMPKKHRERFGLDECGDDDYDDDEMAFLCHNCVSDSDDDPFTLSEVEEDDDDE